MQMVWKSFALAAILLLAGCIDAQPETSFTDATEPVSFEDAPEESSEVQEATSQPRTEPRYEETRSPAEPNGTFYEARLEIELSNGIGGMDQLKMILDLTSGDIVVVGTEEASYDVQLTLIGRGNTAQEAEEALDRWEYTVQETAGSEPVVTSTARFDQAAGVVCANVFVVQTCGPSGQSRMVVEVPQWRLVDLEAETSSGDLSLENLVVRSLDASTSSGELGVFGFLGNALRAETNSGDIEVDRVGAGTIALDSSSGSQSLLRFAAEAVTADASSGSIRVCAGSFDSGVVSTSSGDITVCQIEMEALSVESSSGTVEIAIRSQGDATLRVATSSGDQQILFDARPARVLVETSSGDIDVEVADESNHSDGGTLRMSTSDYESSSNRISIESEASSGDVRIQDGTV